MSIFLKYNQLKIVFSLLKISPNKIYKFFKTFKYPVRSVFIAFSLIFFNFFFNNIKCNISPVWVINLTTDTYLPISFLDSALTT